MTGPVSAAARSMPLRLPLAWLLLGVLLTLAGTARAHEVRPAFLEIVETAPAAFAVTWKQPTLADRRLAIDVVMPQGCQPTGPVIPEFTGSALIERWTVSCPLRTGVIAIDGLAGTMTDALIRIRYLDGDGISQILRPADPRLDLTSTSPAVAGYFLLGVEHLLLGLDHILFVIGLVLFIRVPVTLVKTVTAFTVAHSITLALSVLGLVQLAPGPVEAVIALSILFLARELMVPMQARSRLTLSAPWIMAFAFGLLHGFGFAGALADIGLPKDQLALALLLFNLGIEAGQLMIIGVLLIVLWLAGRIAATRLPTLERGFAVAMGCAAGYWTVNRIAAMV